MELTRSLHRAAWMSAAVAALGVATQHAEAVVVTVTSGDDAGLVVFDSGGFEGDTAGGAPGTSSPGGTSWYGTAIDNGNAIVRTGATADGPASAYQGDQYLSNDRRVSGAVLNGSFSRDLNPQAESFQIDFALWMDDIIDNTASPQAYFYIQSDAAGAGTPTYSTMLAGFGMRYNATTGNPELMKYRISGSGPNYGISTTSVPAPPSWNPGEWNTVRFEWDHAAAKAWLTVNNQAPLDITFAFNDGTFPASYEVPTAMGQFQIRGNNTDSVVFVDSIPEPASAGLLGAGLLMALSRERGQVRER